MMGVLGRRVFLESPVAAIRFQSASWNCVSGILSQRSNYMGKLPPILYFGVSCFQVRWCSVSRITCAGTLSPAGKLVLCFQNSSEKVDLHGGNSRHFVCLTIRTRNNLVQFGIDFLVKLVDLDSFFHLLMPLVALEALRETSLNMVLKKVSKKGAMVLTFRVLFGAVLSPWEHLGDIWKVPDLKKDDFLGDSFLDHFFASTRAPQNVLGSTLATVSARFSHVR